MKQQAVEQAALAGQHQRHQGLRVEGELSEGVQLCEHLEAQQMSLIDDEQRGLLLAPDVGQQVAHGAAEDGQ